VGDESVAVAGLFGKLAQVFSSNVGAVRRRTDNRDAFMWERVSQAEGSQELFCSRTANEQEFERQALNVL
jgi:hypothetical protein